MVILGTTGRNFAAGMSGGIGYVWAPNRHQFRVNCNLGMVELEELKDAEDIAEMHQMIQSHAAFTGSTVAQDVLNRWNAVLPQFVKVMPIDYKRVLNEQKQKAAPASK